LVLDFLTERSVAAAFVELKLDAGIAKAKIVEGMVDVTLKCSWLLGRVCDNQLRALLRMIVNKDSSKVDGQRVDKKCGGLADGCFHADLLLNGKIV